MHIQECLCVRMGMCVSVKLKEKCKNLSGA